MSPNNQSLTDDGVAVDRIYDRVRNFGTIELDQTEFAAWTGITTTTAASLAPATMPESIWETETLSTGKRSDSAFETWTVTFPQSGPEGHRPD